MAKDTNTVETRTGDRPQVTIEYIQKEDGSVEPQKVHTVVISTQHAEPLKAKRTEEACFLLLHRRFLHVQRNRFAGMLFVHDSEFGGLCMISALPKHGKRGCGLQG